MVVGGFFKVSDGGGARREDRDGTMSDPVAKILDVGLEKRALAESNMEFVFL